MNNDKINKVFISIAKYFIPYVLINIFIFLILLYFYHLDLGTLIKYPISYQGDTLTTLMRIKLLATDEFPLFSYPVSKHLSAPFLFELADYPQPIAAQLFFQKIFTLFTDNIFLVFNLYILSSYFLVANVMFFVLRLIKIDIYIAVLISILYTFLPFHSYRIPHTYYIQYFLLPVAIFLILKLWDKKPLFFKSDGGKEKYKLDISWKNIFIIIILVIISIWNFYYTFFLAFLTLIATLSSYLTHKNKSHILSGILFLLFLTLPFAINLKNIQQYQVFHGKNSMVANRNFSEAELYGLKLSYMLLPINNHRIDTLAKLKRKYTSSIKINEGIGAPLGIFGSVSFIGLFLYFLNLKRRCKNDYMNRLSILNLYAFLLGTVGGISAIFALIVSPEIRGYNRISIIIATIVYFALALYLTNLINKFSLKKITVLIISIIILTIGILDITPNSITFKPTQHNIAKFNSDKDFIEKIKKSSYIQPGKNKILQLPYMNFPEHGPINNMPDYAQSIGYLHDINNSFQWSYGAIRGRLTDMWINELLKKKLKNQINILEKAGFVGIYIDRYGYKDNAKSLEQELKNLLHEKPIVSNNKRLSYFKLHPTRETSLGGISLSLGNGFYGWEKSGDNKWAWSKGPSILKIVNFSKNEKTYTVNIDFQTLKDRNITIENHSRFFLTSGNIKKVKFNLKLKPGVNMVHINTDVKADYPGNDDTRKLSFRIFNVEIRKFNQKDNIYDKQ